MLIKNNGAETISLEDWFGNLVDVSAGNIVEVADNLKPRESNTDLIRFNNFLVPEAATPSPVLKARIVVDPTAMDTLHTIPVEIIEPQAKWTSVIPLYAVFSRNTGDDYTNVDLILTDQNDDSGNLLLTLGSAVWFMNFWAETSAVAFFDTANALANGLQKYGDNGLYLIAGSAAGGTEDSFDLTVDVFYTLLEIDGVE